MQFNAISKNPDLDLYPLEMRDTINEVNDWVYPSINCMVPFQLHCVPHIPRTFTLIVPKSNVRVARTVILGRTVSVRSRFDHHPGRLENMGEKYKMKP